MTQKTAGYLESLMLVCAGILIASPFSIPMSSYSGAQTGLGLLSALLGVLIAVYSSKMYGTPAKSTTGTEPEDEAFFLKMGRWGYFIVVGIGLSVLISFIYNTLAFYPLPK